MCTLTVLREGDRVIVTMNRDDLSDRPEAAPDAWPDAAPAFVAPRDLQAGGTWIGANAHGVVACLLNRYDAAPAGRASRGKIVVQAMAGASVEDACRTLARLDHSAYSPFTCLVIGRRRAERVDWTGSRFERAPLESAGDIMVTSSSWSADDVRAQRQALFRHIWSTIQCSADRVAAFHGASSVERDRWAPMMQRERSQTKSVTQIELSPIAVEMRYWTRDAAIARKLTRPDTVVRIPTESEQGNV